MAFYEAFLLFLWKIIVRVLLTVFIKINDTKMIPSLFSLETMEIYIRNSKIFISHSSERDHKINIIRLTFIMQLISNEISGDNEERKNFFRVREERRNYFNREMIPGRSCVVMLVHDVKSSHQLSPILLVWLSSL